MDLSPYLDSVRNGVRSAAGLADEHTRQIVERLGTAIDDSTRLALIEALSDAASTISAELAPSSVGLRMVGQEPEFVVEVHPPDAEPTMLLPEDGPAAGTQGGSQDGPQEGSEDEAVARITLRLPQSVKSRVDEVAEADGISTNAWLLRAVMDSLADSVRGAGAGWPHSSRPPLAPFPPAPPGAPAPPHAGAIFGPHGPFGPHGVFGSHGPFGPGGLFGGPPQTMPSHPKAKDEPRRGSVQGWVR